MDDTGAMQNGTLVKDTTTLQHPNPPQVFGHKNSVPVDQDIAMTEDTDTQVDPGASLTDTAQGYGSQVAPHQQWNQTAGSTSACQSSSAAIDSTPMEFEEDEDGWVDRAPKLIVPDNTFPMNKSRQNEPAPFQPAPEGVAPEIEMTEVVDDEPNQQPAGAAIDTSFQENQTSHEVVEQGSSNGFLQGFQSGSVNQWQNSSTMANGDRPPTNSVLPTITQNCASNWASSWAANNSAGHMLGQSTGSGPSLQLSSSSIPTHAPSAPWTPASSVSFPTDTSPCSLSRSIHGTPGLALQEKPALLNTEASDATRNGASKSTSHAIAIGNEPDSMELGTFVQQPVDLQQLEAARLVTQDYGEGHVNEMLGEPSDTLEGRFHVQHGEDSTPAVHDKASSDPFLAHSTAHAATPQRIDEHKNTDVGVEPETASNPVDSKDGEFFEEQYAAPPTTTSLLVSDITAQAQQNGV